MRLHGSAFGYEPERKLSRMKELRAVIGKVICRGSRGNTRSRIASMKRHKSISLRSRSRRVYLSFLEIIETLLDADLLLLM